MSHAFYSYLAFIIPTSDVSLISLKNNLDAFYAKVFP